MISGKKLHFMHIPKTGGISLFNFLEKKFEYHEICPLSLLGGAPDWVSEELILKSLTAEKIGTYKFFKGHLGWVPRIFFNDDEIETITFLRDPISRSLSYYNFVKENPLLWDNIPTRWTTFEDFVVDKEYGLAFHSNWQTKSFCADLYFQNFGSLSPINKYIKNNGVLAWGELNLSNTELLNLSIERLHKCHFIGLTEHFDMSFEWLCEQYKWVPPQNIPKQNVSTKLETVSQFDSKILDQVLEINQLDFALYQEAVNVFNDRKKTRFYYNHSKAYQAAINDIPAQNEIQFTFADQAIGEGWHAREGDPQNAFSWNSAKDATLIFSLKNTTNYFISFRILHTVIPDLTEKLILLANFYPISIFCQQHPKEGIIFEGIIPLHALYKDSSCLELLFNIPELMSPANTDKDSQDRRHLGFALHSLEIKPANKSLVHDYLKKIRELNGMNKESRQNHLKIYNERKSIFNYHNRIDFYKLLMENNQSRDTIQFTFNNEIIGEGWSVVEGIYPDLFCWNNAIESTLVFLMNKDIDYSISFHVPFSVIPNLPQKITLKANSKLIPLEFKKYRRKSFIFQGIIPAIEHELLELTFTVPELIRPSDTNKRSNDTRSLGFALKTLELKPITKEL